MDNIIREIASKHGINPELLRNLIQVEKEKVHLERRRGAKDELRRVIEEQIEEDKS